MRAYDYEKAKALIEVAMLDGATSASLGMAEDWFWTAEEVWSAADGYKHEMSGHVAGIDGSCWATPTLVITYADGRELRHDAYAGDAELDSAPHPELMSGCLTAASVEALAAMPRGD